MSRNLKLGTKSDQWWQETVDSLNQELEPNGVACIIENRKVYCASVKRGVSYNKEELEDLSVEDMAEKFRLYFGVKKVDQGE